MHVRTFITLYWLWPLSSYLISSSSYLTWQPQLSIWSLSLVVSIDNNDICLMSSILLCTMTSTINTHISSNTTFHSDLHCPHKLWTLLSASTMTLASLAAKQNLCDQDQKRKWMSFCEYSGEPRRRSQKPKIWLGMRLVVEPACTGVKSWLVGLPSKVHALVIIKEYSKAYYTYRCHWKLCQTRRNAKTNICWASRTHL